jgi:hypothetical protein
MALIINNHMKRNSVLKKFDKEIEALLASVK